MIRIAYRKTYYDRRKHAAAYRHPGLVPYLSSPSNARRIKVVKQKVIGYDDVDQVDVICRYTLEILLEEPRRFFGFICGFVDHRNTELQKWRSI